MDRIELGKKLNALSEKIPKKQWKYFHRASVNNFIFNIDLIKDISEQENATDILVKYIDDVESNFEPNSDYSIYLFENYLKNIVPTYRNRLGFSVVPSKYALVVVLVASITVFILLIKSPVWEIFFSGIVLLKIYHDMIKFTRHKVYGFCY